MNQTMEVKLQRAEGDLVRIEVSGKISRDGWTAHRDPLTEVYGHDIYRQKVLVNLSNSFYVDSTGVEWMLSSHRRFKESGGIMVLHSATAGTLQLLKMMRMDRVLHLVPDETAAKRKLEELSQQQPQHDGVESNEGG